VQSTPAKAGVANVLGGKPMPAKKFRRFPLLALVLLAFAIPELAHADQRQYVVAYVEFLPASKEVGGRLLDQLAFLGRHAKGAISVSANQEIQRDNFYVLISVWETAADRLAFESSPQATPLLAKIQPLLEAPIDIRPGTLIE
jgi:quinol monooxygenase YgiN